MEQDSKNKTFWQENRRKTTKQGVYLYLFIGIILYPVVILTTRYIPLGSDILFFSSFIFIIAYLLMLLIKKESFFLIILGKSIFSKAAIFTIAGVYIISLLFVYVTTLKIIEDKENYRFLNEFGTTTMVYEVENIFLLRPTPIAIVSEKLTDQQAKKSIESNHQNKIAVRFVMDDTKDKKTLNYTIYFEDNNYLFIVSLLSYILLLFIFFYFFEMNSKEIPSGEIAIRAIVVGVIICLLFGLVPHKNIYWKNQGSLGTLLTKEMHFLESKENQNYTLILKGK